MLIIISRISPKSNQTIEPTPNAQRPTPNAQRPTPNQKISSRWNCLRKQFRGYYLVQKEYYRFTIDSPTRSDPGLIVSINRNLITRLECNNGGRGATKSLKIFAIYCWTRYRRSNEIWRTMGGLANFVSNWRRLAADHSSEKSRSL